MSVPVKLTLPRIFGLIAVLCVLIAAGLYLRTLYRTGSPRELTFSPLDLENGTINGKTIKTIKSVFVTVPSGKWYDTGLWIGPGQLVQGVANQQPFLLGVGSKVSESRLENGYFTSRVFTTNRAVLYFTRREDVAYVANQEKIYLKVGDENVDELKVGIQIIETPPEVQWVMEERWTGEAWQGWRTNLVLFVVAVVVAVVIAVIQHRRTTRGSK